MILSMFVMALTMSSHLFFLSSHHRGKVILKRVVKNRMHEDFGKWVSSNKEEIARRAPLLLGSASFAGVLLNRFLSGIPPIASASSSQSRADVLTLALAATVLLTGLIWMSIKPKPVASVDLIGIECLRLEPSLHNTAAKELLWAWDALRNSTCCKTLVVVYSGHCMLQAGVAAPSSSAADGQAMLVDALKLAKGSLYQGVRSSKRQSYLANLSLYPGRHELNFLPSNTQAVILQPLGDDGAMIVAGDIVRGFGPIDQAWIVLIGEKLDATLGKYTLAGNLGSINHGPQTENTF